MSSLYQTVSSSVRVSSQLSSEFTKSGPKNALASSLSMSRRGSPDTSSTRSSSSRPSSSSSESPSSLAISSSKLTTSTVPVSSVRSSSPNPIKSKSSIMVLLYQLILTIFQTWIKQYFQIICKGGFFCIGLHYRSLCGTMYIQDQG